MSGTGMTLATRSIDLISTVIKAAEPSSTLVQSTKDVIKWLAREKIDEVSFTKYLEMARGLAYPNQDGLAIRDSIDKGDQRLKRVKGAPLDIVASGSLGRIMARDIELCYIISTIVTLAEFHQRAEVSTALCCMMFDKGDRDDLDFAPYPQSIHMDPVRPIVDTIVNSVFLNVINPGHRLGGLPEELRHLHAHKIPDCAFAGVTMAIRRTQEGIVLVCDKFLGDVAAWLLYHFHGVLEIIVAEKILFCQKLGPTVQTVRMIIRRLCDKTTCSYLERRGGDTFEVSKVTGDGTCQTLLRGNVAGGTPQSVPHSSLRAPLYSDDASAEIRVGSFKSSGLNHAEKNHICAVAKQILVWLLKIHLSKVEEEGLCFAVDLYNRDQKGDHLQIKDLLSAHPTILNEDTGYIESSAPIFKGVPGRSHKDPHTEVHDMLENEKWRDDPLSSLSGVLGCFPQAQDCIATVQKRCHCSACETRKSIDHSKPGCLRTLAAEELLVLLANAVADALGARDVSRLTSKSDIASAMMLFFFQLLRRRIFKWSNCFAVFACTAAGVRFDTLKKSGLGYYEHDIPFFAVQNGCYIAIAPWVDLQKKLEVRGCFRLDFFEGNVKGLSEEVALLVCEVTTSVSEDGHLEGMTDFLSEDETKLELGTAIFRDISASYRLMTFVQTSAHFRIVNPVDAIASVVRADFPECKHSSTPDTAEGLHTYTFDDILALWDIRERPGSLQATHLLTGPLKFNVAMAITRRGPVVRDITHCCLQCAMEAVGSSLNSIRLIQTKNFGRPRILY
ncbi:MAG: hypothetical protein M1820_004909 [Bogoriella megaspora]|nr:MAG: hypothetical protein M1820_004909 [Bogoriella megaspora]